MTHFLLIRHAAHVLGGGTIAGRSADAVLSPLGHEQAAGLADRLGHLSVAALYCSPVERTRQTAGPLAERWGVPVQPDDALTELDFGDFAGRALDDLRPRDDWKRWNAYRSGTRTPGGESMVEVQARVVGRMMRLREHHGDGAAVALVSHGDVIRAALAHALGVPIDLFQRLEVSLASVSVVAVGDYGPWVLCVNHTGEVALPWPP